MNAPPTVPLRQFARAYCRGWELHRIGSRWYAVKRKDDAERFEELKPFPECHADLPAETRRVFTDAACGSDVMPSADRCGRCGHVGRCLCSLNFETAFKRAPMIGQAVRP